MSVELWRNNPNRGKLKGSEINLPSTTFSVTNPTWTGLGSNPMFRGEWTTTVVKMHGTISVRCNGSLSV
jgi:hypothetical protein